MRLPLLFHQPNGAAERIRNLISEVLGQLRKTENFKVIEFIGEIAGQTYN